MKDVLIFCILQKIKEDGTTPVVQLVPSTADSYFS